MDAILQGDGIAVGYQDNLIIPTLSVGIPRGQITAIIGPNGCGKSTLLKALSRTMPLQSGQIILDGEAIARLSTVARPLPVFPPLKWHGKWPFCRKVRRRRADSPLKNWSLMDAIRIRKASAVYRTKIAAPLPGPCP